MTALAKAGGYSVLTDVVLEDGIGGYCDIGRRRIAINAKHSVNQRAKTLVHELSHMLMQEIREQEERPAVKYAEEELIVEAVLWDQHTDAWAMPFDQHGLDHRQLRRTPRRAAPRRERGALIPSTASRPP